jgi:alpha-tubulin suppressor-like RCC1 family protein
MKKLLLMISIMFTSFNLNAQCWNTIYESGYGYNCFKIRNDGTLWSNGDSTLINGQYDPNTGNGYSIQTPTQIGTANNWKSISNGSYHIAAIKTDGTLWTWGDNFSGQLGNGTTINNYSPSQIGNSTNWKSVSSGYDSNLAIKTDGTLWSWGYNNKGQLGIGTTVDNHTPIQIGTANNWLVASTYHSSCFAIKTDGTLWAWGENNSRILGDGTTINRSTPTQIGTANNWKNISVATHILALKTDGTLWSWGMNSSGELGNGNNNTTNPSNYIPAQIGTATNWKLVSAGRQHSLAIKTDGTLWAWGLNDYGQLGDGTTINKSIPFQIGTGNNWKSVTAGNWFSTALKNDGILYSCGINNYGQLGDGTLINKLFLTQINCSALDVEEFKENSFKIYPNPVTSILNVKVDNNLINQPYTIIDGLGRVVINGKLNDVDSTINVDQLSKGIYYLKIAENIATKFLKD